MSSPPKKYTTCVNVDGEYIALQNVVQTSVAVAQQPDNSCQYRNNSPAETVSGVQKSADNGNDVSEIRSVVPEQGVRDEQETDVRHHARAVDIHRRRYGPRTGRRAAKP